MRRITTLVTLGLVVCAALPGLSGCERPVPPADTPAPEVPPPAAPGSLQSAAPAQTMPAPAQESPVVAASPNQVNAGGRAPGEPVVSSMQLAEPPQKLGAPVDLRYQFEGEVRAGQPVTLHLAAVPRVAGSNLTMSIKKEAGVNVTASELKVQKAGASTPYRQDLSVTKVVGGPTALRVLVMMETPEGSAHSWFSIPLDGAPAGGKQQPVRLE